MGVGLVGIDRDRYFLSCKTKMRDQAGAQEELDRSLKRLKTDYFDLYQLHCLKRPEEVQECLAPGGAMETIVKARDAGKVKHIGFSAHTTKAALAALHRFAFDTVMFPINFVEYHTIGFGKAVVGLAVEKGAGVISIKPVSRGRWPEGMERTRKWWYRPVEEPEEVGMAMRFALGLKGVATAIPVSFLDILDTVMEQSRENRPNTDEEDVALRQIAATCESLFRREEEAVALHRPRHGALYPDSPHDGCCGRV
jgi:predicted aldo/keto reductase-like oxidoreductase